MMTPALRCRVSADRCGPCAGFGSQGVPEGGCACGCSGVVGFWFRSVRVRTYACRCSQTPFVTLGIGLFRASAYRRDALHVAASGA